MAQYLQLEQVWDSPRFHCPACGSLVFTERGEPTEKPCPHLLFSWISETGTLYNVSTEASQVIHDLDDSDGEEVEEEDAGVFFFPNDEDFLNRLPEEAVVFGFEMCEYACGPSSFTIVHAICFPVED